jgi:hypothetical protein
LALSDPCGQCDTATAPVLAAAAIGDFPHATESSSGTLGGGLAGLGGICRFGLGRRAVCPLGLPADRRVGDRSGGYTETRKYEVLQKYPDNQKYDYGRYIHMTAVLEEYILRSPQPRTYLENSL